MVQTAKVSLVFYAHFQLNQLWSVYGISLVSPLQQQPPAIFCRKIRINSFEIERMFDLRQPQQGKCTHKRMSLKPLYHEVMLASYKNN